MSPDKKLKAFYRDRNLWLSDADGKNEFAVTTDGNEKARIKYGTASWVYGEELNQTTAMWWSPDSTKIAFYRFDESKVPDYYPPDGPDQALHQGRHRGLSQGRRAQPDRRHLSSTTSPRRRSIKVDVRDGKPFDDAVVGHYVYRVSWSPDGKELLFNRTNRRQNILEFARPIRRRASAGSSSARNGRRAGSRTPRR